MTRTRACQLIEAWLRAERWPFVDVSEARKALAPHVECRTDDLNPFDFVAYPPSGDRLLILICRKITLERQWHMEEWERLFGPGFRAVFVEPRECGPPIVRRPNYFEPPEVAPVPVIAAPSRPVQLALFGGHE
jgi:hypothetical protein